MDRKSLAVLVVCFALLMLWYPLVNRMFPPAPDAGTNVVHVAAGGTNPAAVAPGTNLPAAPTLSAIPAYGSFIRPDATEQLLTLQSDEAEYVFTSHGGGLKSVHLKKYAATVACGKKARAAATNRLASLNSLAGIPAFALLGPGELQGDGVFSLQPTATGVLAEKILSNGVRIVKEFQLGTNYLFSTRIRFENRSSQAVSLPAQELNIGTATPLGAQDDGMMMTMEWYNGSKMQTVNEGWFANKTLGCIPGTPRTEFVEGASNVFWGAVQNQFFTMITAPSSNSPAPRIVSRRVPIDTTALLLDEIADKGMAQLKVTHGFQTGFLYPELILAPNQSVEHHYDVFAGPKEYRILDRIAARFGNNVDLVMGFGGFFGFFARALLLSMNGIHALGLSYGLAIVAITVIIKLLFWPLTNASTKSMKRMAALQPQMKAIQEKYKDDPKKMNQKTMEFMREQKINPAAGCLPILIQLPIFFGFYTMLRSAIELRGASFLWACDLSQPDTVWVIPGLNFPLNPLPLIMGATQLWQMRLTPPSPGMDPVQQKIMQYMPLMFLVILYNFSSGLTLYWTVQNLLTIAQMKVTKATDKTPPAAPPAPVPRPAPRPAPPSRKKK